VNQETPSEDVTPEPEAVASSVSPAAPPAAAMPVEPPVGDEISWPRAILTGFAILFVGFAAAVVGSNRILTKALGLRRTPREWLATGLFFLVIGVLAFVLRRLQARKLI